LWHPHYLFTIRSNKITIHQIAHLSKINGKSLKERAASQQLNNLLSVSVVTNSLASEILEENVHNAEQIASCCIQGPNYYRIPTMHQKGHGHDLFTQLLEKSSK
jgi:biotin synthase-related radical SAM superfamily protein